MQEGQVRGIAVVALAAVAAGIADVVVVAAGVAVVAKELVQVAVLGEFGQQTQWLILSANSNHLKMKKNKMIFILKK